MHGGSLYDAKGLRPLGPRLRLDLPPLWEPYLEFAALNFPDSRARLNAWMKRTALTLFSLLALAFGAVAAEVEIAGLSFQPPTTWQAVPPASVMRAAQWQIVGKGEVAGQTGEVVAFFFGPGAGGDAKANVARWSTTMTTPQGIPAAGQTTTRKIGPDGSIAVTELAIYGTYANTMSAPGLPAVPLPNYGLVGIILEYPGGPLFLRLTGPEPLVRHQLAVFTKFVNSAKASPIAPPAPAVSAGSAAGAPPKS